MTAVAPPQPGAVTFTRDVFPILAVGCANCHHGEWTSSPKWAYDKLKGVADDGPCTGTRRMVPGDAEASLVIRKLQDDKPPCGARMPRTCTAASCLTDTELRTFKAWINAGAIFN